MFKLFLKSVFRSLVRQKMYTTINIIGLMIGILSFSLIMLYVSDENSFDQFHENKGRIYRLTSSNKEKRGGITPYVWGQYLKNDLPEVENYTTFQILSTTTRIGNDVFTEDKVITADSTFFEIFDFPVLEGNKKKFLTEPNKILLTSETAGRYFSAGDAIGKTLEMNHYGTFVNYEVAGIVDCPNNSHIQFDFIIPIHNVKRLSNNSWAYEHWRAHFVNTYLLLSENPNIEGLGRKFEDWLFNHAGEEVSKTYTLGLQPLLDIYQKTDFSFDFQPRGDEQNIQILRIVALGILLMALINFINITSAQSLRRAKEVSLKKVLGVKKTSLIQQFVGESIVVSILAILLSAVIILLILPYFNDFTNKNFTIQELFSLGNILFLIVLSLFVGIASGLYPAILLASYKAVSILSSRSAARSKGAMARKVLVITQFTLTVVLLTSTGVIYNQVEYMGKKNLGFDKEQILVIEDGGEVSSDVQKAQLFREQVTGIGQIHAVTCSNTFPGRQTWSMRYIPEGFTAEESHSFSTIFADHDFLKTYGVEVIKGRDFNRNIYSDSTAILINEAAVGFLANIDPKWAVNPLEKELTLSYLNSKSKVIGVFENFHFESLKTEINPLIIYILPNDFHSLQLRVSLDGINETITYLENTWQKLYPDVPFSYTFVDKEFATYLKADQQLGKLLQIFTILSLIVAILGLFGLASFLAFEKAKEMSIRKVMGASEKQLTIQLSWLFLRLILIANLMAIPLGYFLMSKWMEGFAYRAGMPHGVFALAFGVTVIVTLGTITYHAVRTAMTNPVEILAQE